MAEIALGTKVFTRAEKLGNLLNSIEGTGIDRAYVADDGEPTDRKQEIYAREYSFDLEVIDLEYDAGLGKGRKEIVDRLNNETYLLIVDTDHKVPQNVTILIDQLVADPTIGGIAGTIVEPERGRVFQSAKDFREEGNTLVRSADIENKRIEELASYPFAEFQFIPNAAMFRTACLNDYCWDPNYVIEKEHVDFYVGHWKQTDWRFGVCPTVTFSHHPGGDQSYESERNSIEKWEESDRYFREKWGYDALRTERSYWFDTEPVERESLVDRVKRVYQRRGIRGLVEKSVRDGPRILRNQITQTGR